MWMVKGEMKHCDVDFMMRVASKECVLFIVAGNLVNFLL